MTDTERDTPTLQERLELRRLVERLQYELRDPAIPAETVNDMTRLFNALKEQDAEIARLRATVERVQKLCNESDADLSNTQAFIRGGTPYEADPAERHHAELINDIRAALTEGASDNE